MRSVRSLVVAASALFALLLLAHPVAADEHTHVYAEGEGVVLWASKVGPYHNPSESYPFFSVPGCPQLTTRPLQVQSDSLGALLEGDAPVDTGISFPFRQDVANARVCELSLADAQIVSQLEYVTREHYLYHLLLDELPCFGMIGEFIDEAEMRAELVAAARAAGEAADTAAKAAKSQGFIYTHRDFSVAFNGNQVVEVNLTSENPRPITLGEVYPITYSVTWRPTTTPFDSRFDRYTDFAFFSHSIHWFSLLNSFLMVIFLCAVVLLILSRTIKASVSAGGGALVDPETGATAYRGAGGPPTVSRELDGLGEETGWKLVSGDVFRAPSHLLLYSALLGTGVQLFLLVLVLLLLAVASSYTEERGLLTALFLLCYSLTSGAQGYVSGAFFKQHGGRQWQHAMAVACCFYPLCVISVVFFLNAVAWQQGSQPVLSFSTALVITLVWALVSVPLSIGGTLLARSRTQTGAFPCRVNAIRRLIPSESLVSTHSSGSGPLHQPLNVNTSATSVWSNWYLLVVMGGLLPFGSCFVELYSILTSFWNYSVSYVGGFVLLVFVIFILVSACVSIVATYVLLNSEDYRWHWLAFLASASSSLYIALYALYFFVAKTNMDGVLQTSFYCAYSAMALLTLSLITGSIGSIGTRLFLYKLYSYTKAD